MDLSQVLDALKESKEDGPLVRCFKRFVSSSEDCARELEHAYNSVLPQNTVRGVIFAALSGASTVLSDLGKDVREERLVEEEEDEEKEDEDLDEETLRELPWGRSAASSFVILRVVATAAGGAAAVLQDAEGSVILAAGDWSVGTLLLWNRPHLRLSRDRRLRLVGRRGRALGALADDARYRRHPFVRGACDTCGKDEGKRLACGRCRIAQYCSPDCQKKAWPSHRHICVSK